MAKLLSRSILEGYNLMVDDNRFVYHRRSCNHEFYRLTGYWMKNRNGTRTFMYSFYHNRKHITISENRIIYAWFNGEIPPGYEIIRTDKSNNSYPNIKNLKMIDKKEALVLKLTK